MKNKLKTVPVMISCFVLIVVTVTGCGNIQPKSLLVSTAGNAVMDKESQDKIAESMSTTDTALALDFDWFIDKVFNVTGGDFDSVTDEKNADRITGDEPFLLNGGWKCYMCSSDKAEIGNYERYLNAVIDTDGKSFEITLNWWLLREASLKNGEEFESGSETGTGKWNPDNAAVHTVSDIGNIDLTDFYISKDRGEEYAMGTVTWCSGEVDHIGLMRMTPEKKAQYYASFEDADDKAERVELIIQRAKSKSGAPEADVSWDDDHTITIQLYENVKEKNGDSHTATWDWYTIDVDTMKGEDFFGNPVDLSK